MMEDKQEPRVTAAPAVPSPASTNPQRQSCVLTIPGTGRGWTRAVQGA